LSRLFQKWSEFTLDIKPSQPVMLSSPGLRADRRSQTRSAQTHRGIARACGSALEPGHHARAPIS